MIEYGICTQWNFDELFSVQISSVKFAFFLLSKNNLEISKVDSQ